MKLKEKTRNKILVLAAAIIFFAVHWICSSVDYDDQVSKAKNERMLSHVSEEVKDSRIARAAKDFGESSVLCGAAIFLFGIEIIGLVYFDYRERRE